MVAAVNLTTPGYNLNTSGVYNLDGAPVDGPLGTLAGAARPGALLIDNVNAALYQNTGTQSSPVWSRYAFMNSVDIAAAWAIAAYIDFAGDIVSLQTFDYYCDSVRGSDAFDGLTAITPKRTIAALSALVGSQNNKRIGLARGSYWREMLSPSGDNLRIGAYSAASAARPILDCAYPLVPALWTLSAGQTNTYQQTITLPNATNKQWVNAWAAGVNLTFVTSIAACEATAGSYYVSNQSAGSVPGASQTLYIHPTGSTDPRSDGVLYEYSRLASGISLAGMSPVVVGVETRRNAHHDGSLVCYGRDAIVYNCAAKYGAKHNMLVGSGVVQGSTISEQYYADQSADLLVFYGSAVTGQSWAAINNVFSRTVYPTANVNAIYSHTSDGSVYTKGSILQNVVSNVTKGFDGTTGAPLDCDAIGNVYAEVEIAQRYSPVGTLNFLSNRHTSTVANAVTIDMQSPCAAVVVSSNDLVLSEPGAFIQILAGANNPATTIERNLFYVNSATASAPNTPVSVTTGALAVNDNIFDGAGGWSGRVLDVPNCTSFAADRNIYGAPAGSGQFRVTINGVAVGSYPNGTTAWFAAARALSPAAEVNSTTAASGSYAYLAIQPTT